MTSGLLHLTERVFDIDPTSVVMICAAGRASSHLATLAALLGLHVRLGMEDTIWEYPHKDDLITNNAALFQRFKGIVEGIGRRVATGEEYRSMIGLPSLQSVA